MGLGTTTPQSKLDVDGGVAIGSTYSGTTAAPTNGLIVEGNVGIGDNNPGTKMQISASQPYLTLTQSRTAHFLP